MDGVRSENLLYNDHLKEPSEPLFWQPTTSFDPPERAVVTRSSQRSTDISEQETQKHETTPAADPTTETTTILHVNSGNSEDSQAESPSFDEEMEKYKKGGMFVRCLFVCGNGSTTGSVHTRN